MLYASHWQYAWCWKALAMHHLHAAHADACDRRAMIGIMAADHDRAAMLALNLPIMADHAQNRVIGFGAGAVKKYMWQAATC